MCLPVLPCICSRRRWIISNMQPIYTTSMRVFLALLKRTFFVIVPQLKNTLIDGLFLTSIYVLLFGYLYPEMGMRSNFIGPVFIGSILTLLCSLSFSLAVRMVNDLKYQRFIDYLFTLPIAKTWLFGWYVASFLIELVLATAPLLMFGLFLLRNKIDLTHLQLPLFHPNLRGERAFLLNLFFGVQHFI